MSPGIVNATKKAFKSTGGVSFGGGDALLKAGGGIVGGFVGGTAGNYFRRDQYGRALGPGAVALDSSKNRFVKGIAHRKVVRGIMNWNDEQNADKTFVTSRQANAKPITPPATDKEAPAASVGPESTSIQPPGKPKA